jgi:hypothetical protein
MKTVGLRPGPRAGPLAGPRERVSPVLKSLGRGADVCRSVVAGRDVEAAAGLATPVLAVGIATLLAAWGCVLVIVGVVTLLPIAWVCVRVVVDAALPTVWVCTRVVVNEVSGNLALNTLGLVVLIVVAARGAGASRRAGAKLAAPILAVVVATLLTVGVGTLLTVGVGVCIRVAAGMVALPTPRACVLIAVGRAALPNSGVCVLVTMGIFTLFSTDVGGRAADLNSGVEVTLVGMVFNAPVLAILRVGVLDAGAGVGLTTPRLAVDTLPNAWAPV